MSPEHQYLGLVKTCKVSPLPDHLNQNSRRLWSGDTPMCVLRKPIKLLGGGWQGLTHTKSEYYFYFFFMELFVEGIQQVVFKSLRLRLPL